MNGRNWILTINNETRTDLELEQYIISHSKQLKYAVFQREIGENGTEHIQLYLEYNNTIKFETLKSWFPRSHIERRNGSPQQARDYCMKDDTRKEGHSPIEIGEFVSERGKRTDLSVINEMIENGAMLADIRQAYPSQYTRYNRHIKTIYNEYKFEEFSDKWRDLSVYYISGNSGVGKTRFVMEKYGYRNVYRITDYKNPFDAYDSQDVIIFEEFRSSIPIEQMLNYLDGYPLQLPARYDNKTACFTKVYIISNWQFNQQYEYIQDKYSTTWEAFSRRITKIYNILDRNDIENMKKDIDVQDFIKLDMENELPF